MYTQVPNVCQFSLVTIFKNYLSISPKAILDLFQKGRNR